MSLTQILEHTRGRLERLGHAVTSAVWRLGFASRFLFYTVLHSATALRRFRLTVAEIYFAGVLSVMARPVPWRRASLSQLGTSVFTNGYSGCGSSSEVFTTVS